MPSIELARLDVVKLDQASNFTARTRRHFLTGHDVVIGTPAFEDKQYKYIKQADANFRGGRENRTLSLQT